VTDKVSEPRCQAHGGWDINSGAQLCRTCGETKPQTEFHLNRSKARGRDTQCRHCVNERKKKKRRRGREREDIRLNLVLARSKKFRAAMDGILNLICNEMVGSECQKEHQND
jgi:hypothetical protein